MVMENLRSMLHQYNTEESLYFGHRYADMSNMPSGYMAGEYWESYKSAQINLKIIYRWRLHFIQSSP